MDMKTLAWHIVDQVLLNQNITASFVQINAPRYIRGRNIMNNVSRYYSARLYSQQVYPSHIRQQIVTEMMNMVVSNYVAF